VTVLSYLLFLCRLRWGNFKPQVLSASYAATGLYSLPLESAAKATRAGLLAMASRTTFLGALESSASSRLRSVLGRA
jgi:hypothetical protein